MKDKNYTEEFKANANGHGFANPNKNKHISVNAGGIPDPNLQ